MRRAEEEMQEKIQADLDIVAMKLNEELRQQRLLLASEADEKVRVSSRIFHLAISVIVLHNIHMYFSISQSKLHSRKILTTSNLSKIELKPLHLPWQVKSRKSHRTLQSSDTG